MYQREFPPFDQVVEACKWIAARNGSFLALGEDAKLQSKLLEAHRGRALVSQERLGVAQVGSALVEQEGYGRMRRMGGKLPTPAHAAGELDTGIETLAAMWRFTRNNGITEGFQREMKLIHRRAYGTRKFPTTIAQCGSVLFSWAVNQHRMAERKCSRLKKPARPTGVASLAALRAVRPTKTTDSAIRWLTSETRAKLEWQTRFVS